MTNRLYARTQITVRGNIFDDDVLTDPTEIRFFWKIFDGQENEETPVKVSTGIYDATFTPERGGNVRYRWQSTTPTTAREEWIPVTESQFTDYQ